MSQLGQTGMRQMSVPGSNTDFSATSHHFPFGPQEQTIGNGPKMLTEHQPVRDTMAATVVLVMRTTELITRSRRLSSRRDLCYVRMTNQVAATCFAATAGS